MESRRGGVQCLQQQYRMEAARPTSLRRKFIALYLVARCAKDRTFSPEAKSAFVLQHKKVGRANAAAAQPHKFLSVNHSGQSDLREGRPSRMNHHPQLRDQVNQAFWVLD